MSNSDSDDFDNISLPDEGVQSRQQTYISNYEKVSSGFRFLTKTFTAQSTHEEEKKNSTDQSTAEKDKSKLTSIIEEDSSIVEANLL